MNGTPTRSSLSKCRKTLFEFNTTNLEQLNYDMQKLDLKENEANNERREERKVIHKNKIQKMKAEEPCQVSKRLAAIRKRYQETLPNQIRRQQIRRNINPMREGELFPFFNSELIRTDLNSSEPVSYIIYSDFIVMNIFYK